MLGDRFYINIKYITEASMLGDRFYISIKQMTEAICVKW